MYSTRGAGATCITSAGVTKCATGPHAIRSKTSAFVVEIELVLQRCNFRNKHRRMLMFELQRVRAVARRNVLHHERDRDLNRNFHLRRDAARP